MRSQFLKSYSRRHAHRLKLGSCAEFLEDRTLLAAGLLELSLVQSTSPFDAGRESQGEVASLPQSEPVIHEWNTFRVEVWASTPDGTDDGVSSAFFSLDYDSSFFTPLNVFFNGAFIPTAAPVIDDVTGRVTVSTVGLRTDAGDDARTLIAAVQFSSQETDHVLFDAANHFAGPFGLGLSLADAEVELVTAGAVATEAGDAPPTALYAVPFDINNDQIISLADVVVFADAFGRSLSDDNSEGVWGADYNKDQSVSLADLVFLAANFSLGVEDGDSLVMPGDFPGSWQAPDLTAQLVNDTAPGGGTDNDGITFDPTIQGVAAGNVTEFSEIVEFQARLNGSVGDPFTSHDATGLGGTFVFDASVLAALNGDVPLPDGEHVLHIRAIDVLDNFSSTVEVPFSLDATVPNILVAPHQTSRTSTETHLELELTEPIIAATLSASNFLLRDAQSNPVNLLGFQLSPDSRVVELTYALVSSDPHELVFDTTGVADSAGNSFAQPELILPFQPSQLPIAADDDVATDEDTPLAGSLLANNGNGPDSDPEGGAITIVGLSSGTLGSPFALPSGAMMTVNSDGTFSYDPGGLFEALAVGESFDESFTYTVSDDQNGISTASVTVTLNGANDTPTATDDGDVDPTGFNTDEHTAFTTADVLLNDDDTDDTDTLSVVGFDTTGTLGLVTNNLDGTFDYDPNGQFNNLGAGETATDTFDYTVSDGNGGNAVATVTITIAEANLPPIARDDAFTVNEDSSPQVFNLFADNGSGIDIDPEVPPDTFEIVSTNTTGTSGTVIVTNAAAGTVSYEPADDTNGSDSFTYTIRDAKGGESTATVFVTITSINDAPSFDIQLSDTSLEDAGAQSVINFATSISPGPPDETPQSVSFEIVGNTNSGLFSSAPAISSTGTLAYAAVPNANGTATITVQLRDDGGTTNGGIDVSSTQTFDINVTAVNDIPSFSTGADQTVLEDAGAQSVSNFSTSISVGPGNESTQTPSFEVTGNTNTALFAIGPAIAANGTLTYTPATNANGNADITVVLHDDGGTANGGVDTTASQSFSITVTSVNDAPSFNVQASHSSLEDAGTQTINSFATSVSPGPSNEAAQTVSFEVVGNTNADLFSAAPAISPTGTLTYTAASHANGSATITVRLGDNGGTANGGINISPTQTFDINVTAVNDAPSFSIQAEHTSGEDDGPQTVSNFATSIVVGPANEVAQTVTFEIVGNTNSGMFSMGPAISSTGTLTYTAESETGGTATITVQLRDNGGTTGGGVDVSPTQTFDIVVNNVNDAPIVSTSTPLVVDPAANPPNQVRMSDVSAAPIVVSLHSVFTDPEGDALSFSATSSNTELIDAQVVSGSFLQMTRLAYDSQQDRTPSTITVRATEISTGRIVEDIFTVVVDPHPAIEFRLIVVTTATTDDELPGASLPTTLTDIAVGTTYFVELWVSDLVTAATTAGPASDGLLGAYINVSFDQTLVTANEALDHAGLFDGILQLGTVDNSIGVVTGFGGTTIGAEPAPGGALGGNFGRIGHIEMTADSVGSNAIALAFSQFPETDIVRYNVGDVLEGSIHPSHLGLPSISVNHTGSLLLVAGDGDGGFEEDSTTGGLFSKTDPIVASIPAEANSPTVALPAGTVKQSELLAAASQHQADIPMPADSPATYGKQAAIIDDEKLDHELLDRADKSPAIESEAPTLDENSLDDMFSAWTGPLVV